MSKRNIVILGVVLLLAVVSVITIVVSLRGGGGEADPYKSESSQTQTESEKQTPQPTETNNQDSNQPAAQTPTIDPASISEIDIPAFGITVSYLKDIPGFSYTIQRAANNTEYVEFTSDQLVSNRCTDDKGVFATIIKNAQPGADSATVSSTTKVGAVTYGLSLAAETCAADKALLQTYQKSFKDAFPLLKASTSNQ